MNICRLAFIYMNGAITILPGILHAELDHTRPTDSSVTYPYIIYRGTYGAVPATPVVGGFFSWCTSSNRIGDMSLCSSCFKNMRWLIELRERQYQ
jgi:hypothetical protein